MGLINTKIHRDNLYLYLTELDLITPLIKLLIQKGTKSKVGQWRTPWVYVCPSDQAHCDLYHRVFFDHLNHIHSFCRECWKVVVRPRNIIELFDLYELQKDIGTPCKCGKETRETTSSLYGGYFYNRGKKEGLEKYEEVRKLVNDQLSPETPVILKRACTEFEIGEGSKGPSDKWPDITWKEREWELRIEALFPRYGGIGGGQPIPVQAYVMREWIHYAHSKGDPTYKQLTGGTPLVPPYVTYHKETR